MFDLVIRNANIIDGTKKDRYLSDIGIRNGKIEYIGKIEEADSKIIDAKGRFVTPGFIDIHRHADFALFDSDFGLAETSQGLTTIVNGNCGLSIAPITSFEEEIKSYLSPITGEIDERPFLSMGSYLKSVPKLDINTYMLVGMGTLRASVAGYDKERLSEDDYKKIHTLLDNSLRDGAIGVSLGLGYAPECFYTTDELIKSLSPIKDTNIPITIHMRNEGDEIIKSVNEVITLGKALNAPVHISHLKAMGKENHGKVNEIISLIENARNDGVKIDFDFYPYTAGSTQLMHILPNEVLLGGIDNIISTLKNRDSREKIVDRIKTATDFENIVKLAGFDGIKITSLKNKEDYMYIGKSIEEISNKLGKDPFDTVFDILVDNECDVTMIDFMASENDIKTLLKCEYSNIISDSTYPSTGLCHPRVYGTFSRVLEKYVKDEKVISLEKCIHKMTQKPASVLNIKNKGVIDIGCDADINIFDLENIKENATYENPRALSTGIDYVIKGGEIVNAK